MNTPGLLFVFMMFFAVNGVTAKALVQDVEVYTDDEYYFARGRIDQKILKQSRSAAEVIQAGLDSVGEVGGEIFINSGKYLIDSTLVMKSRTRLRGRGRSTELIIDIQDADRCGIYLGNLKGSTVSDLSLISAESNKAANGLAIAHSGDCKVLDVYAEKFPMHGIYMGDNSFLCEIRGCSLAGNRKAAIMLDKLRGGGRGGDYVPNLISNCIIYGGNMGIEMNFVLVANITGCIVYQTEGPAFYMHDYTCSINISGCRTFQLKSDAVVVDYSFEICITGNTFCWHEGNGIVLNKSRWGTITGNQIIDSGSANVFDPEKHEFVRYKLERQFTEPVPEDHEFTLKSGIVMLNETKGFTVTGNAIFNWPGVPFMEWGITEDKTCFKNIFANNNINKCVEGAISSAGKDSVVGENLSHLPAAYHGNFEWDDPKNRLIQFYDPRYIPAFIEE